MADSFHSELHNALQEAGVGDQSARAAAREAADARGDAAKSLIWTKAVLAMVGGLVAINAAMLSQMFDLTAQVAKNSADIATLQQGQADLRRGQDELRRGQDELRRNQEELISFLQRRLSDAGLERPGPGAPAATDGPEVSGAPAIRPGQ